MSGGDYCLEARDTRARAFGIPARTRRIPESLPKQSSKARLSRHRGSNTRLIPERSGTRRDRNRVPSARRAHETISRRVSCYVSRAFDGRRMEYACSVWEIDERRGAARSAQRQWKVNHRQNARRRLRLRVLYYSSFLPRGFAG